MDVNVIKIGNSKGIRLSKTILEEYEIDEVVELILKDDHLEIWAKKNPRQNWETSFKQMIIDKNEEIMIPNLLNVI